MHLYSLNNKLTLSLYIDCESVYPSNSAVKQSSKTLRKIILPVPLFYRCWLHPQLLSLFIVSKWVALVWWQTDFGQSIRPAGNQRNPRLRSLTALNTSSWKDFWSKDDSSHCENSPSFEMSWTWSDVFQINEKFIHICPPCLLAEMAKVVS